MPPACPFLLGQQQHWRPRWLCPLASLPPLAPLRLMRRLTLVVPAFHEIAPADEAVLPDYAVTPEQFAADLD